MTYTQPLVRGLPTDDSRRQIEIAKKNLTLTDVQFRQRATEVITRVEHAYWELVHALKNMQVQSEVLSGATTPIEAMPDWMQPLTDLNPVKHFAVLARGVMLKGVGLDVLYPNFIALFVFTAILVGVSAWRFRKQLN